MHKRLAFFTIIPLAILLPGCASTSTKMVNNKGQIVDCGAWGIGIIGAPAALISTQNCVDKAQAAGFRELGSPEATASNFTPYVVQQSATTSTPGSSSTTMTSKDGSFKLTLPADWTQAPSPTPNHQLFAKNTTIDAGLFASSVKSSDIHDWHEFAKTLKERMIANLNQATASEIKSIKINGFDALQADVGGTSKNGMRIHYLGTLIKTDTQLIQILTWCIESKFSTNRIYFESLPAGLQI